MAHALTIDDMAKGRGRPKKASKAKELTLNVDIPDWLKWMCDDISNRDDRDLKYVVARLLKKALGLKETAEGPEDFEENP